MGVLDIVRGRENSAAVTDLTAEETHERKETSPEESPVAYPTSDSEGRLSLEARDEKALREHPDEVNREAQIGVQKAEAVALVWSKSAVYGIYAWIWVCFFLLALSLSVSLSAQQKAYADFLAAPEVSTAQILATAIGGILRVPIAKIMNVWGRGEGFVVWTCVYILGTIILAACDGPSSYAAGYVLYMVGYDAIFLMLQIFIADTSGLRNRAFAFAFALTPFICTAFTGPLAGASFINHTGGWRWAYGAFAIVMTFTLMPLALVFKFYERKAKKLGLLKRESSGRTLSQSIMHYIHEFDVAGCFIFMAAWLLILLPFSLTTSGRSQYSSPTFIAMFIVGWFVLLLFALWEKFVAKKHFINYELFKKRTVLGACCTAALLNFSFYCWDLYFLNFCYVVYNMSISNGGYMLQIYNIGSCFWGVVFGIYVRVSKEFKYFCLCFGVPLLLLGAGLMIHFRGEGGGGIGYIVMCQIFIAFGGGTVVVGQEMAVMAAADREGVPMMLGLIGLFSSLGASIGSAVSAAIYNNTFQDALRAALPEDLKSQTAKLFNGGYLAQMAYPMGSPARVAINHAWGISQRNGSIAATALLALCIPTVAIWKNYKVDRKQNKGTIL